MKFDCKREEEYKTLLRKKGGPAHILRKRVDTDCGKKDLKRLVERRKMAKKGERYIKKRVDEKEERHKKVYGN
jgi:hypothetical protein